MNTRRAIAKLAREELEFINNVKDKLGWSYADIMLYGAYKLSSATATTAEDIEVLKKIRRRREYRKRR